MATNNLSRKSEPLSWVPVRGGPKVRMEKSWTRPPEDQYLKDLNDQGFIVPEFWTDDEISDFPMVLQDLRDLDEYLLPLFFDFNQKAKYYQNRFYLFQWVFLFGAFFTTILAVMTTYFSALEARSIDGTFRLFSSTVDFTLLVSIFGYSTLLVSAITSYYTLLSNQGEPRKRWASYRRLTEELRMMYFKYVTRLQPFHTEARVDELRRRVLDIRRREQENG
ncbi:MAG: DUF4231 domain-containing protein [Aggregatilineales bacterium]